ncbi:MAG: thiolase family protein [Nocardioidaceae bacterium]
MQGRDVFIIDAVRTPIGKFGGALAQVRPDDMAAAALRTVVDRQPGLDPARIDEVTFGDANQAGEDNRNVGRMAVLLAGLPTSIPGSTVNRLCASGLDAVVGASRAIAVGEADLVVAGGVESMTRAPYVVQKSPKPFPAAHSQMWSTTLGWRMVNPDMPDQWSVSLGEGAEILADEHGISREQQDEFAVRSHRRAAKAWADGVFDDHLVALDGVHLDRDESIRPDSTVETLAGLRASFRKDGTVTAGNASPLSDGAAALMLASEQMVAELGAEPLARVVSSGAHGVDPHRYGIGPVKAVETAMERGGRKFADLTTLELNEAFAAQSLACLRSWTDLDPEIVNPWGGAIAVGHPLGCSGARLAGAVAHQLKGAGSGTGVASLCIGVGQGLAVVLER